MVIGTPMWEYNPAMHTQLCWSFFAVTYFDPEKNYRTTILTATDGDDALVTFTAKYPQMEILSVRNASAT